MRQRAKSGARTKESEREEGRSRERDGKEETTDNPLLKNLRDRWRPQYSDWPVLALSVNSSHDMMASRVSRLL